MVITDPSIACDSLELAVEMAHSVEISKLVNMTKMALRHALKSDRSAMSAALRMAWDAAICTHVLAWWHAHPVASLGIYWPMPGEPDLRPAYVALAARGVQFALPIVVDNHAPLQFAAWAVGDALKKDVFGVLIPAAISTPFLPDALLIPCLGFNAARFRLGYGGGFYDRTLALSPRPLAIGIAYGCAQVAFDAGPHDIALDQIITELITEIT